MENRERGSIVRRGFAITGMVVGGIAIAVLVAFVFGFAVQWLWNWLLPDLFGFKTITYWQAFAMIILARLLVGGIGGHGRGHRHGHGCGHRHGMHPFHGFHSGPFTGRHGRGFFHGHKHGHKGEAGPWREEASLWDLEGGPEDWFYYREYWKSRGKADFEEFVRERKSSESEDTKRSKETDETN